MTDSKEIYEMQELVRADVKEQNPRKAGSPRIEILVSKPIFGALRGKFSLGPIEDNNEEIPLEDRAEYGTTLDIPEKMAVINVSCFYHGGGANNGYGLLYSLIKEESNWQIKETHRSWMT